MMPDTDRGRTQAMIEDAVAHDAQRIVVVGHSGPFCHELLRRYVNTAPAMGFTVRSGPTLHTDDGRVIQFMPASDYDRLRGLAAKVFIDHAVLELVPIATYAVLRHEAELAEARLDAEVAHG